MALSAIILYKLRRLKDGSHPVMMRVTYKGERKYFSMGVPSCQPHLWDEISSRYMIKADMTKKEIARLKIANNTLADFETRSTRVLEEIKDSFSFNRFESLCFQKSNHKKVLVMLDEEIDRLKESDRASQLSITKALRNMLASYRNQKDFTFYDIDKRFLDGFEHYLLQSKKITIKTRTGGTKEIETKCTPNGVAVYMRHLRSVVNNAINSKYMKKEYYPFDAYKISTETTAKRALTADQIDKIINYPLKENTRMWHSRNMFLFSFFTRGMNLVDIAHLKPKENIKGERIVYIRSKTRTTRSKSPGKPFSIPIRPKVAEILHCYGNQRYITGYVFPILKPSHTTVVKKMNAIKKMNARINEDMQTLAALLKFDDSEKITLYSARHSWATITKKSGASTELIQEGMGHADARTTEIYLAQFDNEELDKADNFLDKYQASPLKKSS